MATTPEPRDESDPPAPRWTGRASVSPESIRESGRSSVAPVPSAGGLTGEPVYRTGKKARPRWRRVALVSVIVLALIATGVVLSGYFYVKHVNDSLKRTGSVDSMVGGNRPLKTVEGAQNILLLGSDTRDPSQPVDAGGNWRTDTIELMHIPASHDKAYLISIPRDLWVHIPQSKSSQYGNTDAKINAAAAWGGVPLTVQTVEEYTGVRIDHLAMIDFAGFQKVVDALGGVDMYVDQTITSIFPPHRTFQKGMNHFNGAEALDYVRQRYQFADGDFSRQRHQQEFLKAVLQKADTKGTVTNIDALTSFINSVAASITVDQDFSLIDMAWQFHGLTAKDMTFMTLPNDGTGMEGDQSVVLGDQAKDKSLFAAINNDTVAQWLAQPGNAPN
jgi:LCP family protein required for cell wall assembly